MTIKIENTGIPLHLKEDTDAILAFLAGQPLDPNIARRIRERGDRIREQILREHGVVEIGVSAIRELRDE